MPSALRSHCCLCKTLFVFIFITISYYHFCRATEERRSPANSANGNMQRQPSSSEPTNPGDLRPFKDPNRGLDEVLKQLESEEWYGGSLFQSAIAF